MRLTDANRLAPQGRGASRAPDRAGRRTQLVGASSIAVLRFHVVTTWSATLAAGLLATVFALLAPEYAYAQQCFATNSDGVLAFEGESLTPVSDWQIQSTEPGAINAAYLVWTGPIRQSRIEPNSIIPVELQIAAAGRYRLDIRAQIGQGTAPDQSNDLFVRFADAGDAYGWRRSGDSENRRYPRPTCEDNAFISSIEALPDVGDARCAEGSTLDDFFKVFAIAALDWTWRARTSDGEGYEILVEFPAAGSYTMELAPRSSFMLIDRVVIADLDVSRRDYQALGLPETPCAATEVPIPLWALILGMLGLALGANMALSRRSAS